MPFSQCRMSDEAIRLVCTNLGLVELIEKVAMSRDKPSLDLNI